VNVNENTNTILLLIPIILVFVFWFAVGLVVASIEVVLRAYKFFFGPKPNYL